MKKFYIITIFALFFLRCGNLDSFNESFLDSTGEIGIYFPKEEKEIEISALSPSFEKEYPKELVIYYPNAEIQSKIKSLVNKNFKPGKFGTGLFRSHEGVYYPQNRVIGFLSIRNNKKRLWILEESRNESWIFLANMSLAIDKKGKLIITEFERYQKKGSIDEFYSLVPDKKEMRSLKINIEEVTTSIKNLDEKYKEQEAIISSVFVLIAFLGGYFTVIIIINIPNKTRRWSNKKKNVFALIYAFIVGVWALVAVLN